MHVTTACLIVYSLSVTDYVHFALKRSESKRYFLKLELYGTKNYFGMKVMMNY